LAVSGAVVAGGAGYADRLGAGGRQVEGVEVGFGHGAVEADGCVGHRQREGDGVVGLDEAEFAGGGRGAGLAPAVDGVDGGGFGRGPDGDAEVDVAQVADRAGEFQLGRLAAPGVGVVEEFGADGIPAGAAVVVGRVPVREQADEQDRVDRFGGVGVAEPDPLRRSLPRARIQAASWRRVATSSVMTVSMKFGFPARNSWPPDLGAVIAAAAMSWATWRMVAARSSW